MRNSHIFALKTIYKKSGKLVLTFTESGGSINKLSLRQQRKLKSSKYQIVYIEL